MAVAAIPNTTLSAALARPSNTDQALKLSVVSAASITTAMILVVDNEVLKVQDVDTVGNFVYARRGVNGSEPFAHASGARVYYATPETWQTLRDQSMSVIGNNGALPQYLMPGQRGFDGSGREFILLDLTFTAYSGVSVLISRDGLYTASALTSASYGSVGVMVEEGTSNQFAWAQIWGPVAYLQYTSGSSLATSTGIIQPATTATVPVGAVLGRTTSQASSEYGARIIGMQPTSAVTTATTAATSATGFSGSAWLHYPFLERQVAS